MINKYLIIIVGGMTLRI